MSHHRRLPQSDPRPGPGASTRSPRRLLRPLALALAAVALLAPRPTDDEEPARSALTALATGALAELDAYRDTPRSRRQMLINNLSRYLAVYQVPSNLGELDRLLGASSRINLRFARQLYDEAAARSTEGRIGGAEVRAAAEELVPGAGNPYHEIVYFPAAARDERVVVETWDLDAYLGTGAPFEVLLELGRQIETTEDTVTVSEEGAAEMARALTSYGLLILRIGGRIAAAELAEELRTDHLRQAAKAIATRAAAVAPEVSRPPGAGSVFSDVTSRSGIAFRHVSSAWISQLRRILPRTTTFSGGGVAAADLDGDGWSDLVICGGKGCASFINRRDGTFVDTTVESGLGIEGEARMPLPADFDNDGDPDLFVTFARDTDRLFENRGDGTFVDVTAASGLERDGTVSGPAIAVDVDGDALLDLYVGGFGDYLSGEVACCGKDATNGSPNRLYRGTGGLRFVEIGEGTAIGNTGWAQAISHADLDRDGDQDIYIANDFGRNELLLNNGDGSFVSAGATAAADGYFHGMNVSFADLNRDLAADIFITNIWHWHPVPRRVTETNTLLLSDPGEEGPRYRRVEDPDFVGPDTGWSWAGLFFDYDLDADDDLFIANGFNGYFTAIQHRPHPERPGQLYPLNNSQEANLLLRNDAALPTTPVEDFGAELPELNSRAAALLDFDRDGDLDLALTTFHSDFHLFENTVARAGNGWVVVRLVGDVGRGSNRDAIGAQLVARTSEGAGIWRSVTGGEGYLSRSSPEIEIGLGPAASVDLEITWPNGERDLYPAIAAGRAIRITQGRDGVEPLWTE